MLLKYALADGAIVGLWESGVPSLLESQQTADPDHGYVQAAGETFPYSLMTDYYVVNGTVTPKQVLTITATPTPFPADGVTQCQVSVSPFLACTLLVNGTPQALTDVDPTLEITSDVPQTFQVALQPLAAAKAEPLTITAEAVPVAARTQEAPDANVSL